jgi:uncharacterized protein YjbJ (UPF0337 family)
MYLFGKDEEVLIGRVRINERNAMNADVLKGKWKQAKGKMKQKWGRLTSDDIDFVEGSWDRAVGRLQERYGWEKEQAERELEAWQEAA